MDLAKDLPAVKRIWREIGWVDDEHGEAQLEHFFNCGNTLVATLGGEAECAVQIVPGTMRLQFVDLPLCAVTAVTTSRIARGQAFAQRLTALQLASGAKQGASVAALGMFDQGFYDKLGFATGAYDHSFTIDPATLNVDHRVPSPERVTVDDYEQLHAAMRGRLRSHGGAELGPAIMFRAEIGWDASDFGLGYRTDGKISHFVWLGSEGEHGPYELRFWCYQNTEQLLQLLGLLKSLADQVYSLELREPAELQLQAILKRPFRHRALTSNSEHASQQEALAWWQFRVLDVPRCVAALQCAGEAAFQLQLSDPLADQLPAEQAWRGVAGSYLVRLGPQSSASPGSDTALPLLECSVAALSRLLWGIVPASTLALVEGLSAPPELLARLDAIIALPRAVLGREF